MKGSISAVALSLLALFMSLGLEAQENSIVISDNISIGITDDTYDNLDIVIDGAILTIDGSHSFANLILKNGAVLKHSIDATKALQLVVVGTVDVDSSSKIDLTGLGSLPSPNNCDGCGGAFASFGGGQGETPYGTLKTPNSLGSGGRHTVTTDAYTRGGGRLYLRAGSLNLAGKIVANGESQTGYVSGGYFGGGAGGSIYIEADSLGIDGSISANGGSGNGSYGNGGSGGRIAVYAQPGFIYSAIEKLSATGGAGKAYGGPGTIYLHDGGSVKLPLKNANAEYGSLRYWDVITGNPQIRTATPYPAPLGGRYYFYGGSDTAESKISQNVSLVRPGLSESTLDNGKVSVSISWKQSSYDGSDEGQMIFEFLDADGGIISTSSSGLNSTIDGAWENRFFTADVPSGTRSLNVVVHAFRIAGAAANGHFDNIELTAAVDGEPAVAEESSAGLAIIHNRNSSPSSEAYYAAAAADFNYLLMGSKVILPDGVNLANVKISGDGNSIIEFSGAADFGSGDFVLDGFDVIGHGAFTLEGELALVNSSTLSTARRLEGPSLLDVTASNIFIGRYSSIDLSGDGRGYPAGGFWKSGGSYGGLGGRDPGVFETNSTFGSISAPLDFGVGGYPKDSDSEGSFGGGALKLTALGKLEVYGQVLANGQSGVPQAGAGSGGSIWIDASELIGGAYMLIEASGGNAYQGGAGGGGRVAAYFDSLTGFDPQQKILARSGGNYSGATAYGGAGTVYLYDKSLADNNAQIQIINRGVSAAYEPYIISGELDVPVYLKDTRAVIAQGATLSELVTGQSYSTVYVSAEGDFSVNNDALVVDGFTLELSQDYSFETITLRNSAKITTPAASDTFTSGITLSSVDFYVSSNSYIDVSSKGRRPVGGDHWKSGGSYGGPGGVDPTSGTVATTFGSVESPVDFGVGGNGADATVQGSRGGGAIKLVANNKFELYGDVLANGQSGLQNVGAGSGGSIWIETKELIGSSATLVEASGGRGYLAGTGGGGRVAIYYDSISGIDTIRDVFARAGTNYSSATGYGGPGTVYLYDRSVLSDNARLQIINRDTSGSYSPYSLTGSIDVPIYFEDIQVRITKDAVFSAPVSFKDAKVYLEEGVHLGLPIIGSGYSAVYVTAEGDFSAENDELVVDGYTLELPQDYSFEKITLKNSAKITTPAASDTFTSGITLSSVDFYVSSNSYIDVSNKGLRPESGDHWKSGGSYGGPGGVDPTSGTVATTFGSVESPIDFGVGGNGADANVQGSRGGGAIKLVANNKFELYGDVLANGQSGLQNVGAGSGGSIWIEAKELIGGSSTLVEASGGRGYLAGTGGGGRVAIYYDSISGIDTIRDVFARAGTNYSSATGYGGPGTVYLFDRSLPSGNSRLQIVNRGTSQSYDAYVLTGTIDIPIYFEDLRVRVDKDVNFSAPLTFKDARVSIDDGAHLASSISGSGHSSVYVTALGDFTVANNALLIDGYTLELAQDYSFASITIKNSGKLTTPYASETFTAGITLSAIDFYISSNSYIDLNNKGLRASAGDHWESGGSYGGLGGIDPSSGTVAPMFGSFKSPTDFGVGGLGADASVQGSRGGGAIKLVASNRFEVYGDILANGNYAQNVGGGSGGSIWIEASEIIGNGATKIEASGGYGYYAASGGGGRIALYYDSISGFDPLNYVVALAGPGTTGVTGYGGAGTVYLYDKSLASNNGRLQIVNRSNSSIYTPFRISGEIDTPIHFYNARAVIDEGAHLNAHITGSSYSNVYVKAVGEFSVANDQLVVDGFTLELPQDYTFESINIQNSGKITTPYASDSFASGITLSANDFYISSNSYIDISNRGRRPESGNHWKSGGSYGGLGGIDPSSGSVAALFGSFKAPSEFGVGGFGADETVQGSRGGGAIKLVAANRFEVYGDILANGNYSQNVGGGSGGSIWIEASEIIGSGATRIEASGGYGYYAASGGGGRIALYYDSISGFNPLNYVVALSGPGTSGVTAYGGPGTVYLYDRSLPANNGRLQIVNRSNSSAYTPFRISGEIDTPIHFYNVRAIIDDGAHLNARITGSSYSNAYVEADGAFTVADNAMVVDGFTLELPQDYSFESIRVQNNGKITTPAASDSFISAITLAASDIYISSNSYIDVSGKGHLPAEDVGYKSGGSYGGLGGVMPEGTTNAIFGSAVAPIEFGMGGRYQDDSQIGHRGGGAIKLVADRLQHFGFIYANGAGGTNYKGGGSGGSIWLDIGELVVGSNGYIQANGGYGSRAGAGSGGRIAIYYESVTGLNTGRITSNSGSHYVGAYGEAGTVHIAEITVPPRVRGVEPSGYHDASINNTVVQFNIGIDSATLDASDFELVDATGGSIDVLSVTSLDDIRYQVDFSETLSEGSYTLNIGPDIFGTNGLGMDQDQDGIELEPEDDKFSTQVIIDLTQPEALSLDQPVAPAVIASSKRWVTISGSRDDNTAILVDGNEIVPNGSGNWSGSYYLSEGESTISVVAQDLSGNQSEPVMLSFNVDSKAPSVTGANPSGSQNVAPPFITVVVTEEGSGIDLEASTLTVKRNGVALSGSVALYEGQVQFTPDAPFLDGEYQIVARIADKLGNLSTQKTYNFVLDYTPPAPTVLGEYPSITTVNAQTFSGSKEAGSAVLVNGSLEVIESAATTWSKQVALLQGDNTIEFVVRDAAGNESAPTSASIRYDNNPPGQVALSIDPNGRGTDLLLDWSSYDEFTNGNDIDEYRIYQSASAFTDIAGKTPVAVVGQGTKQFRVEGLPRATEAHFAVVAYDTQALFNPAVVSASAVPVDVQAPDEIANLIVEPGADSLSLRWNPSANSDGDLAGYKVAFVDDADGRIDDIPLASLSDPAAVVQYQVSGLNPATSYPIRVYAYDAAGNTSNGVTDAGTTLLPNPATVTAEPKSSQVAITWSSVAPYNLLKNYAVYVQEANFSSVEGLQAKKVQSKGSAADSEHTWSLAGLKNGTTYYVAVTAINLSGGSDPQVTPVAVTPVADTEGPVIEAAHYQQGSDQFDLAAAPQLSQDGRFEITASDDSDIARVEFFVDGTLLGTEYAASNGAFGRNLTLQTLTDGDHALTVKVFDVWENSTIGQYTFEVLLAPPAAPQITAPVDGSISNQPLVLIQGNAEKGTQVQLYRDGTPAADLQLVNSYGKFQIEVTLEEGANSITAAAEYPNRSGGFGPHSAARTIELNTSIPDAPANLAAIERELGQISCPGIWWKAAMPTTPLLATTCIVQ
ncbi:Ig-like domain-containing protein [Microbulbifer sp. YPW1]|uniref:fibronectin type III domain-containing protein n=1 Tax=Microbulbifer sp. YPW1 TaxID=2745199 RepID=UPI001598412B|nr:Ig-like domain-containing protein [Microbulbifer sp. YPW1]QKX18573.1 fibronectin type III domain-containing protein [Microbulbifer sp. YPW1]